MKNKEELSELSREDRIIKFILDREKYRKLPKKEIDKVVYTKEEITAQKNSAANEDFKRFLKRKQEEKRMRESPQFQKLLSAMGIRMKIIQ